MNTIKLYPYQKVAASLIIKKLKDNNLFLLEASTGSGKSIISTYLALVFANDKKVIISTSTNQLALEMLDILENKKFDGISLNKKSTDLVIGTKQYIDIDKLNLELLSEFITNTDEVLNILHSIKEKGKNKYYFVEDFITRLNIIDEDKKELVKKLITSDEKKEYIKDFDEVDISITNHFYFLTKVLYDKNFNLEDYVIILDEFHLLSDIAEVLKTNSFSLYRYNFLSKLLLEKIQNLPTFSGQKTLVKDLQKHFITSSTLLKELSKKEFVGENFLNNDISISITKQITTYIKNDPLVKKLNKLDKLPLAKDLQKIKSLFIQEIKELNEISNANIKEVVVYMSASLGYPRLSVTKGNILYDLKYNLWDKIDKAVAMSATLTIDKNDDEYIKKRLGIYLSDIKSIFYKMNPVFKKEQLNIEIVDKNFPIPNTTEEKVDLTWIEAIGDKIIHTYNNKNSLVLVGGFLEVQELSNFLKLRLNTNIITASKDKSMYQVVEEFKKKGGILIGTRNFGTGLDLKGDLLINLYITKLPFPIITNKKWIEIKQRDASRNINVGFFLSENEMLLHLKQYIGRLIRTATDKGNLYILDSRIHKNRRLNRIKLLIENSFL